MALKDVFTTIRHRWPTFLPLWPAFKHVRRWAHSLLPLAQYLKTLMAASGQALCSLVVAGPLPQQHDAGRGDAGAALHGRQEGQGRPLPSLGLHQGYWILRWGANLSPCLFSQETAPYSVYSTVTSVCSLVDNVHLITANPIWSRVQYYLGHYQLITIREKQQITAEQQPLGSSVKIYSWRG